MAHIQVLDKHTAELIAAGEVVERPASVVKELFENAVDAGATAITVEIEHGGVTLMRLTDNGCGISREDVPTAFLRHATSKIRTEADLDGIGTLGFRGEALASVAAVARVELVTCAEGETVGTRYVIEGGEEVSTEDAGRPQGTTITVRDLFYNVPARMKFLKTDLGEGNAVAGVVDRLALSHPEIAVRFLRDGKETLVTAGDGELFSCIYAVFGREFATGLTPVDYAYGGVRVHGFVSKVECGRQNRTMQHFFVNGRYVKTRTVAAALEQAYKGLLMVGKYPTCVLYLELPLEVVDVNVHPAKIEVRFVSERPVFDTVYHGVKSALEQGAARKEAKLPDPRQRVQDRPAAEQLYMTFPSAHSEPARPAAKPASPVVPPRPAPPVADTPRVLRNSGDEDFTAFRSYPSVDIEVAEEPAAPAKPEPAEPALPPTVTTKAPEQGAVTLIGEAFATYVIAEMDGDLYLIDKHAAHERILYNKLKETEHNESQQLLAPVSVSLSAEEQSALLAAEAELNAAGFEIEPFGGHEVLVRAIPLLLSGENVDDVVREVAGGLAEGKREVTTDRLEWLYHNTACRAAIKAGNRNQPDDLLLLAEQVLHDETLRTCPHGRPVCIRLTRREIEKQFGRIV